MTVTYTVQIAVAFSLILVVYCCSCSSGRSDQSDMMDSSYSIYYSKKLTRFTGVGADGKATYEDYPGNTIDVDAEVSKSYVKKKSPSIAEESSCVTFSVAKGTVPGHPGINIVKMFYDPDGALLVTPISIGSKWRLKFNENGEFVDINQLK